MEHGTEFLSHFPVANWPSATAPLTRLLPELVGKLDGVFHQRRVSYTIQLSRIHQSWKDREGETVPAGRRLKIVIFDISSL